MIPWKTVAVVLLALGTMTGARAEDRGPAAKEPAARPRPAQEVQPVTIPLAHQLWAILDLVQANHPEPPSRQDMILAGAKSLFKAAKTAPSADLDHRIARLTTRDQFTAFLQEVWPGGAGAPPAEELEAAVRQALLAAVPGQPRFYPPEAAQAADVINGNRYVGLGIQVRIHVQEKLPQIVSPFGNGPARRAGIKPGDLLVEVDGKSCRDVPISKVVEMLRGDEGTPVTVVVRTPGVAAPRTLKMTRAVVPFNTVFGYRRATEDTWTFRIEPAAPIGYLRLDGILSSTPHELRRIEQRLRSEKVRALVLDLRASARGSSLHNGALVADTLLDGGLMWRVRGPKQQVREYRAGREGLFRDWPLVVLIDENLDQAAAAVAAALQDNGRATLVGQPTRNGGFVTSLVPLPDGQGALALRTGQVERAARDRGWPVQPDHAVPISKKQREALVEWFQAKNHLEQPGSAADRPPEDPQLARAVELLRAALKKAE
jgi:carboxyl-terminal processing protease